jgi:hypothetical protein
LPPEIGLLRNLTDLRLDNNELVSLPSELCTQGDEIERIRGEEGREKRKRKRKKERGGGRGRERERRESR